MGLGSHQDVVGYSQSIYATVAALGVSCHAVKHFNIHGPQTGRIIYDFHHTMVYTAPSSYEY